MAAKVTVSNETLISLVHSKPSIWNVRCTEYHITLQRQEDWNAILQKLKLSALALADLKQRWKNLRDTFKRKWEEAISSRRSGAGATEVVHIKWPYFGQLLFLRDVIAMQPTTCTMATSALRHPPHGGTSEVQEPEHPLTEASPCPQDHDVDVEYDPILSPQASTSQLTPPPEAPTSPGVTPSSGICSLAKKFPKKSKLKRNNDGSPDNVSSVDQAFIGMLGKVNKDINDDQNDDWDYFLKSLKKQVAEIQPQHVAKARSHMLQVVNSYSMGKVPSLLWDLD